MKQYNPLLDSKELKARLDAVADQVVDHVAFKQHRDTDASFETASDEFGLVYGVSKILEKSKQQLALIRDGQAHVRGEELTTSLKETIGYALLFIDYINRNQHLITDGRAEESVAAPGATPTAASAKIQSVESEFMQPHIPSTDAGNDPYDAR